MGRGTGTLGAFDHAHDKRAIESPHSDPHSVTIGRSVAFAGLQRQSTRCDFHDSIAGPIKICQDDRYREMFDTIIVNLDKPDLGLGSRHKVQPIHF